jgi:hypothetical protein
LSENQHHIIQKVAVEAIQNELVSLQVLPSFVQNDFIKAIEIILASE